MNTRTKKFLVWSSVLAFILACAPTVATPFPTVDPNQVNQFIAQTANAAGTQTAAVLPTSTATETLSPTPENTFTPSPTFTSTVIFILPVPIGPVTETATFSLGGGGTSADDFACEVLRVTPPFGTSLDSRESFDVIWTVKNIGQRKWNEDVVQYVYESGERMHTDASYSITTDVSSGEVVDLVAQMEAPRESGDYTTTWTLRRGSNWFCQMLLTITVR